MCKSLREFVRDENDEVIISYGQVVREERFFCAVLFHLLISDLGFLDSFLKKCGVLEVDLSEVRVFIEYAMARDLWNSMEGHENVNHNRVLFLKEYVPSLKEYIPKDFNSDSIREFNQRLVAGPSLSNRFIQSPGCWSMEKVESLILGGECEVEGACMLKWAFNIKPDIVIEYSNNHAVCIEAKVESDEDMYKFENRYKITAKQTEVQKFLMKKILGYETKHVFLRNSNKESRRGSNEKELCLSWTEVFPAKTNGILNVDENPMVKMAKKRLLKISGGK
ncbi:MAG: hypothetical protein GXY07_00075 [Candidatus Hydrogenedentes bacterium]|nr:hypothetical protein [Candidatus Hydrogenedentota bacterium]